MKDLLIVFDMNILELPPVWLRALLPFPWNWHTYRRPFEDVHVMVNLAEA
jgi:hypothetical protein